jgi:hypothetical protein
MYTLRETLEDFTDYAYIHDAYGATPERKQLAMLSLREMLADFTDYAYIFGIHAPDELPAEFVWTYHQQREHLCKLWATAKPQLKRDLDKVAEIDRNLAEAVTLLDGYQAALDRGETPDIANRTKGRKLLWDIYMMKPTKLR